MRGEKKKIIERVMEKETYKVTKNLSINFIKISYFSCQLFLLQVAIEILNRFADKSNGFKTIGGKSSYRYTPLYEEV